MAQEIKNNSDYIEGLDKILTCMTNKYHLHKRFNVGAEVNREEVYLVNSLKRMYCNDSLEGVDSVIKKLNLKYNG